jgi:hypothetical protein
LFCGLGGVFGGRRKQVAPAAVLGAVSNLMPSRLVKCWHVLGAIRADSRTDYYRRLFLAEMLIRDQPTDL